MVVAGWQHEEEQVDIDVVPGHGEIIIPEEEIPGEDKGNVTGTYPQNKSIATTYVNNESYLEFEVKPESVMSDNWRHRINFKLRARGEFEEDLEIDDFQFLAVESDGGFILNSYNYHGPTANLSGVSPWEYSKQQEQPYSFGFDVDSNEFTAEIGTDWAIVRENWRDAFTLEMKAIVGGLAEEVSVSIDVHVEGGDEA